MLADDRLANTEDTTMRCNDCNKFVGYDEPQVEVNDVDVDEGGHVNGSLRVVLNCAECGTELKAADFDLDHDFDLPDSWCDEGTGDLKDGYTLTLDHDDGEGTSRTDGKPGTPARYTRTFYGFTLHCTVTCEDDEGKPVEPAVEFDLSDDVQASSMDECQ